MLRFLHILLPVLFVAELIVGAWMFFAGYPDWCGKLVVTIIFCTCVGICKVEERLEEQ